MMGAGQVRLCALLGAFGAIVRGQGGYMYLHSLSFSFSFFFLVVFGFSNI